MIYTYMYILQRTKKKTDPSFQISCSSWLSYSDGGNLGWIGHISLYITFARGSCRALTQKILQSEARKAQGLAGDRKIPMNTVVERPRNSNFFLGEEDFWCCIVWQATRGYSKVLLISSILVHFSELQAILPSGSTKCQPRHLGESSFWRHPLRNQLLPEHHCLLVRHTIYAHTSTRCQKAHWSSLFVRTLQHGAHLVCIVFVFDQF